jgi:hypothetical protein
MKLSCPVLSAQDLANQIAYMKCCITASKVVTQHNNKLQFHYITCQSFNLQLTFESQIFSMHTTEDSCVLCCNYVQSTRRL